MKGKNRGDRNYEEIEERVISITSSLFGETTIEICPSFFSYSIVIAYTLRKVRFVNCTLWWLYRFVRYFCGKYVDHISVARAFVVVLI